MKEDLQIWRKHPCESCDTNIQRVLFDALGTTDANAQHTQAKRITVITKLWNPAWDFSPAEQLNQANMAATPTCCWSGHPSWAGKSRWVPTPNALACGGQESRISQELEGIPLIRRYQVLSCIFLSEEKRLICWVGWFWDIWGKMIELAITFFSEQIKTWQIKKKKYYIIQLAPAERGKAVYSQADV